MGGLFKKPKPPAPPKPTPMPDEEDARKVASRRQSELMARSGLQSTLLSDVSQKETLG